MNDTDDCCCVRVTNSGSFTIDVEGAATTSNVVSLTLKVHPVLKGAPRTSITTDATTDLSVN